MTLAVAIRSELELLRAAARALRRRPLPLSPHGRGFSSLGRGTYARTVLVVVILLAIEATAAHLLLGTLIDDSAAREILRAVLLLSTSYLAVWLIGDLRLLQESDGVVVSTDFVTFDLGQRARGRVALADILGVSAEAPSDPIAGTPGAIRVTVLSLPNCCIELRAPVELRGLFGRRLLGARIDLHVDNPAAFEATVTLLKPADSPEQAALLECCLPTLVRADQPPR